MEEKKENERPKTAGQLALELLNSNPHTVPLRDFSIEMLDDKGRYMKTLWEAADYGKSIGYHDLNGMFYITVSTHRERLLPNIFRNKFTVSIGCPVSTWSQTVYQYNYKHNSIQLLWTLPDMEGCNRLRQDCLLIEAPEERKALKYVLDFADGTLDKMCCYLNGTKEIN